MLFKVTHISANGKRTQVQVQAQSNAQAMDRVELERGQARVVYCVCLSRRAPLRIAARREGLCA